jgi:hypothetical protein
MHCDGRRRSWRRARGGRWKQGRRAWSCLALWASQSAGAVARCDICALSLPSLPPSSSSPCTSTRAARDLRSAGTATGKAVFLGSRHGRDTGTGPTLRLRCPCRLYNPQRRFPACLALSLFSSLSVHVLGRARSGRRRLSALRRGPPPRRFLSPPGRRQPSAQSIRRGPARVRGQSGEDARALPPRPTCA